MTFWESVAKLAARLGIGLPTMAIKVNLDERVVKAFETLAAESVKHTTLLTDIRNVMRRAVPPRSARNLSYRLIKELPMDRIIFALAADPPDADVAKRELTLTLNPGTPQETLLAKVTGDKTRVDFAVDAAGAELGGPQDAFVKASLVDIDDAGNAAEPDEITFQLLDTFPPAKASGLGVRYIREDIAPDPTPAPEPTPTPEPTPPAEGG